MDLALDEVQSGIAKIRPHGSGYILLLGPDGAVISAPDKTLIGKPLPPDMPPELGQGLQSRRPARFSHRSSFTGEKVITVFRALPMAENNSSRGFAVSLPIKNIAAETSQSMQTTEISVHNLEEMAGTLAELTHKLRAE